MAAPLAVVLGSLNANSFLTFYLILVKDAPECMVCQGLWFTNVEYPFNMRTYK